MNSNLVPAAAEVQPAVLLCHHQVHPDAGYTAKDRSKL